MNAASDDPATQTPSARATAVVFDFGERRIGVATANRLAGLASALTTLTATAGVPDWNELDRLIKEWQPGTLVVGIPRDMAGADTAMTQRALEFAASLSARYERPVETVDERLTSAEASGLLRERRREGTMKRRVKASDVDSEAARLIAETWLRS